MSSRRTFLAQSALLAATPWLARAAEKPAGLIDGNVHLGAHPNRDLPPLTEALLEQRGVTEAWAGSFEALLQRDLAAVNARLARRCAAGGRLRAVGCVHPGLPAWRDDLQRCVEQHGMPAIRLYPGHHGYTLADPVFTELLEAATARRLPVQLVAQMEDPRTQHPRLQTPPVDLKPLRDVLARVPEARVLVLNANAVMAQTHLRGCANVWLDTAMIEGVAGIENLLRHWPQDRLIFGSHAPFFYWESAALKLQESELSEAQLQAVRHANARSLQG